MKTSIRPAVKRTILLSSVVAGLSACGGGGDGGNGASAQGADAVPQSAVASTSAFVNYLNTQPLNETGEPLDAGAVTPPTTDTDEPTAV